MRFCKTRDSSYAVIRNIFIFTRDGIDLFTTNFGDCHSLEGHPSLTTGFLSALHSFGESLVGEQVKQVSFESLKMIFHAMGELITVIAVDDDNPKANRVKAERIGELFLSSYPDIFDDLPLVTADMSKVNGFADLLLELGIAERNCGNRPYCLDCPNRHQSFPVERMEWSLVPEDR